jgi:hypothetical protein
MEKFQKGGSPYIRLNSPSEIHSEGKIVVPLRDLIEYAALDRVNLGDAKIENFDEKNRIVTFRWERWGHLKGKTVDRRYKFTWNLKSGKVFIGMYWSPFDEKKWRLLRNLSLTIPYGYYGYGWRGAGDKKLIWVPIVPLAKILWGEKRWLPLQKLEIPTCLHFPNKLMIFTSELTLPSPNGDEE